MLQVQYLKVIICSQVSDNRNGSTALHSAQSNVIGIQTSGLNIQSTIQTSLNAPTLQSNLALPSSISLNINPQNLQTSIANNIRCTNNEIPHNLVVQRTMPSSNGLDLDNLYRQPLHLRNGIHESYRRDTDMSPTMNNHENFLNRRVSEYEDDDHTLPQVTLFSI